MTADLTNRKTWFNFFQEFARLLLFFVQWKCKLVSQTALYARQTKSKGKKKKQSHLRFLFAKFSINTGVSIPSDAKIKRSNFCQVETLYGVAWHEGRCGVFLYLKGWFSWHFEPPETNLIRTLGLKHSLIESVWEKISTTKVHLFKEQQVFYWDDLLSDSRCLLSRKPKKSAFHFWNPTGFHHIPCEIN